MRDDNTMQTMVVKWLDAAGEDGRTRLTSRGGWTSTEILVGALGVPEGEVSRSLELRLAKVMRALGFIKIRPQEKGGARPRRWVYAFGRRALI